MQLGQLRSLRGEINRRNTMKVLLKLLFLTSVLQFRASAETAGPAQAPVQHVIFVDQSASPGQGDAERWIEAANRMVFEPLRFGDSFIIYGVHDHTAESAPLLEVAVPAVSHDAGMDEIIRARVALRGAREKGAETVRTAVHSTVRS